MMRVAILAIAALFGTAAAAVAAQQWTDRTILTFSAPVMVPGKTLPAGKYVFELQGAESTPHTVQIRNMEDSDIVTLVQAVPMKRVDPDGDVVVRFDPAGGAAPVALKGWFVPGSIYGHQFIYSDDEARLIANRTKSLVLSMDMEGTDREKGLIRVLDPNGSKIAWRIEDDVARDWDQWVRERREATTAIVGSAGNAPHADLDDLDEPRYLGAIVSVDGEVEEVFGPRLFAIDEARGADEARAVLVYLPSHLAALVREDDKVTVTGTVRAFARPLLEREWGWTSLEPRVDVEFVMKPILVASRLVGGDDDVAMVINAPAAATPVGTSGVLHEMPMTGLTAIASGGTELVGQRVDLTGLLVEALAPGGGFYVRSGNQRVFVLPVGAERMTARDGDSVAIEGVVLQMPAGMRTRVASDGRTNADIYVYATSLDR